jgi:GTP-binding protein
MGVPQIVIVGRPNVGKSSLFNWLAGRRLAIVDPTAGVTRDRVSHLIELGGRFAELVDTGGMGIEDSDNLTELVEEQIQAAVDSASVLLFVVDTREGALPLDHEVARRLRYVDKPVILVANKTDHQNMETQADEFYRFGRKIIRVSAKENRNKDELLAEIRDRLPPPTEDETQPQEPVMKIAMVGRRNTGKSTLVNSLARANDRQRSARHDARQRRCAVRDGRQGLHRHRHARLPAGEELRHRRRFLQHAPCPAEHSPS